MEKIKEYSNGEVTVVWEAEKCIHSAICARGLPEVFNPRARPWIKIDATSTTNLIGQVKQCPSGALSYYMNIELDGTAESMDTKVEILENGPLLVYGPLKVILRDGFEVTKNKTTAFCRCGASNNKPFCDGTHVKQNFVG
jgi:uncharacterized Fe-S cluster protein YjdI